MKKLLQFSILLALIMPNLAFSFPWMVRDLATRRSFLVEVNDSDTLSEVKSKLNEKTNITDKVFYLNGRPLDDSTLVRDVKMDVTRDNGLITLGRKI